MRKIPCFFQVYMLKYLRVKCHDICVCVLSHSIVFDSVTPWIVARQAPLSMGFSRQEYWSGLPFPTPGDLPNPGMEPRSPALLVDSLPAEPSGNSCWMEGNLFFLSSFRAHQVTVHDGRNCWWLQDPFFADMGGNIPFCCHPVCLIYMLSTSWEMPGWMSYKPKSR